MDSRAAITGMQALIDDKVIDAELCEKEKAKEKYDDAISSGDGGYLMERSEESKDIFVMRYFVDRFDDSLVSEGCLLENRSRSS